MQRKQTARTGSVPRRMSVFGWMRRRGGAGSVAAALAVIAVLVSVSFAATACSPDVNYHECPPIPVDNDYPVPWDKTDGQEATPEIHGAMPERLPC